MLSYHSLESLSLLINMQQMEKAILNYIKGETLDDDERIDALVDLVNEPDLIGDEFPNMSLSTNVYPAMNLRSISRGIHLLIGQRRRFCARFNVPLHCAIQVGRASSNYKGRAMVIIWTRTICSCREPLCHHSHPRNNKRKVDDEILSISANERPVKQSRKE